MRRRILQYGAACCAVNGWVRGTHNAYHSVKECRLAVMLACRSVSPDCAARQCADPWCHAWTGCLTTVKSQPGIQSFRPAWEKICACKMEISRVFNTRLSWDHSLLFCVAVLDKILTHIKQSSRPHGLDFSSRAFECGIWLGVGPNTSTMEKGRENEDWKSM